MKVNSVFISYSWDSVDHKSWVAQLAERLRQAGLSVRFDQWDLRPGSDVTRYMEASVRESDFVLLVCTPEFATRADARIGGVGYEQAVVTGEIFSGVALPEKFIPCLRGDPSKSIPTFLKTRVWVDFREDNRFTEALRELLFALLPEGEAVEPGLSTSSSSASDLDADLLVYDEALSFARSKAGLAKSRSDSEEFAESAQHDWDITNLKLFEEIYEYANTTMKLPRAGAEEFAMDWMLRGEGNEFGLFREAFEFAIAKGGMNLRLATARQFLRDFVENTGLHYFPRFEKAYRVARGNGRTRDDAEDFAFRQL